MPLIFGKDAMNSNEMPVLPLATVENMFCSLKSWAPAGLETMHGIRVHAAPEAFEGSASGSGHMVHARLPRIRAVITHFTCVKTLDTICTHEQRSARNVRIWRPEQTCELLVAELLSLAGRIRIDVESQVNVDVESGTAMASNLTRKDEIPSVNVTGPPALHAS